MIGTIAISGLPPFSGFFSKDEILAHAFEHSPILWGIGVLGAMFTAFYMFRMMFLTFYGKFRGTHEQEHHLHESPASMTIPLIILAILSAIGGLIGVPEVLGGSHWLDKFLEPVFHASNSQVIALNLSHSTEYILMAASVLGAVLSIIYAYFKYVKSAHVPVSDTSERGSLAKISYNKYYIDELYNALITKPLDHLSEILFKVVDKLGIDGFINGLGKSTIGTSNSLRLLQSGNVGFYIFMMVAGIVALLLYGIYKV